MMSQQENTSAAPLAGGETSYVALCAGAALGTMLLLVAERLAAEPESRILVFHGNYDDVNDADIEALLDLKDMNLARLAVHFIMAREPEEGELLNGRLDAAKLRECAAQLFDVASIEHYFVAGPESLTAEWRAELLRLGVAPARIAATGARLAEVEATTAASTALGAAESGVTRVDVVMDGRRRSFPMQTGTESILDAAARAGIDLPFSCRAGVCSTCRTKLVRGEVELAQNYALEDWELEQGFILACQAHAKTADLEITYDET